MRTVFLRALEADKETSLRYAIHGRDGAGRRRRFEVNPDSFAAVPRAPFAYWVSNRLLRLFKALPPFESNGRTAKVGLQTSDDFRFLRLAWEVSISAVRELWFPFVKGGVFSPFYADVHVLVNWRLAGREIEEFSGSFIRNSNFYFLPGFTWPVRAIGFSPNPVPAGCIFSVRGYLATGPQHELLEILAVMSSAAFEQIFRIGLSGIRPEFIVGVLAYVPFPPLPVLC